jgi:hypothetical protein
MPNVPIPRVWRPGTSGTDARAAALANQLALTAAPIREVLCYRPPHPDLPTAQRLLAHFQAAEAVAAAPSALARFAGMHQPPATPGPHSSAAMTQTVRTMGRKGLGAAAAWNEVRQELQRQRGGPSVSQVFRVAETTFLCVHDSSRRAWEPEGLRAAYAWDSRYDGPAIETGDRAS